MDKNQMKNKKYWEERFGEIEKSQNKTGLDAYREIERSFDKAQRNVQGKIDAWVARFANNNNLSMADAKRLLSSKELKEFKWDVEEYIKYGQQNAFTGEWMKELENASARYHISRLESLKIQMQHELEMVFGNELDVIDQMAKKVYNDGYYKSIFEVQRGFNLGWGVFRIDENKLDKLIGKPWAVDGKNFSSRVWQSKTSMVNELHSEFIRTCVTGKSPDDAIRHLTKFVDKKFKNAKVQAGRLVMTEQAYFASVAQKDAFNELDVEEYEIVATLDSRTSETCRDLDGEHFPMKDYQAGVTAPPFHVWCRSTTVPWFEDDYGGQRSARGEDGKTYYVPSNMTYREWEKTFVSDDGVVNIEPEVIKDVPKVPDVPKVQPVKLKTEHFPDSFNTKTEKKHTQQFVDYINNLDGADPNVVELYSHIGKMENIESDGIPFSISHASSHAVDLSYYPSTGKISDVKLTIPKMTGDNPIGQVSTILHEEMHLMDLYNRVDPTKYSAYLSESYQPLVDAMANTTTDVSDDVLNLFKDVKSERKRLSGEIRDRYRALNDELRVELYGVDGKNYPTLKQYKDVEKKRTKLTKQMNDEIDYVQRNALGGAVSALEDIYDAISKGQFRDTGIVQYGHGSKYYSRKGADVRETVANYASISVLRPDLVELLRKDKPELVKALDGFIETMLERVKNK